MSVNWCDGFNHTHTSIIAAAAADGNICRGDLAGWGGLFWNWRCGAHDRTTVVGFETASYSFFFLSLSIRRIFTVKSKTPFIFHFCSFLCDIMNIKKAGKGKAGCFFSVWSVCLLWGSGSFFKSITCAFQANTNSLMTTLCSIHSASVWGVFHNQFSYDLTSGPCAARRPLHSEANCRKGNWATSRD